jgi:glucose/arabinose dehydrogenase
MRVLVPAFALAVALSQAPASPQPAAQLPLTDIKLPPGFTISLYADGVTNARQMALGEKGTLFVGSRRARRVFAIVDKDGDKKGDQVQTIANGLNSPSGIAFRNG